MTEADHPAALLDAIDALDRGRASAAAALRGCATAGPEDLVCAVLGLGRAPGPGRAANAIRAPVVVVAGDTAFDLDPSTADAIRHALSGLRGTLVGGGTSAGIAGLVASIGVAEPGLETIGYLPRGREAFADRRYDDLRFTVGDDYSLLDSVVAWGQILDAGIPPASVRLLGVGGGSIAGLEYRLGLALGARVGLLAGSGRGVDDLLGDERWTHHPGLRRLIEDADAIRDFLTG